MEIKKKQMYCKYTNVNKYKPRCKGGSEEETERGRDRWTDRQMKN